MHRYLQNLLLVTASTIIGLLILEALLWWKYPPPRYNPLPSGLVVSNSLGALSLAPNFIETMDNRAEFRDKQVRSNAEGRRVVPASSKLLHGGIRLHLLGDSQTFGHGLSDDESWPNNLQMKLLEAGIPIRVENWGVPGANVEHYWRRLPELLKSASPGDTLLIGLTWNDFTTSPGNLDTLIRDPRIVDQSSPNDATQKPRKISGGPVLGVPQLTDAKTFLRILSKNSAFISAILPAIKAVHYQTREKHPINEILASGVTGEVFKVLSEIQKRAENSGIRFSVMLLTNGVFLVDQAYATFSQDGRFFPTQNVMGDITTPLCKAHKIHCIDAFNTLHVDGGTDAIYPLDGHYTPVSAQRIASLLADQLAPLLIQPVSSANRADK